MCCEFKQIPRYRHICTRNIPANRGWENPLLIFFFLYSLEINLSLLNRERFIGSPVMKIKKKKRITCIKYIVKEERTNFDKILMLCVCFYGAF